MSQVLKLKFPSSLREIRLHLCRLSDGSKGVREFVKNQYSPLKAANPGFPILIREANGVQAKVFGRFSEYFRICFISHEKWAAY